MAAYGSEVSFLYGGPFFRMQRVFHAKTPRVRALDLCIAFVAVTWFVTFCLAVLAGQPVLRSFLFDSSVHARMLLAGPVAILAEPIVEKTLREAAKYFVDSTLVPEEQHVRFQTSLNAVVRFRDSAVLELILLFLAFAFSMRVQVVGDSYIEWLRLPSAAGTWYAWVSRPLLNFLLFRWLFRVAIWIAFLVRTSRLSLRLAATHPDRAGGLGFLGEAHTKFGLVVLPFAIIWSAGFREKFKHGLVTPESLKVSFVIFGALVVLIFLGPLIVFSPALLTLRERAIFNYGHVGIAYVRMFEKRWMQEGALGDESLLGSSDIQSLSDLQTSVRVVNSIRFMPVDVRALILLSLSVVVPALPLITLIIPFNELVSRALRPFF
jgi:hypothetical protein